jgi:glycosyltransferase involved in cell wall biosynthesis
MPQGLTINVTLIMPVYNGGNFLSAAVESALSQDLSNLEVLVIDDGSKDNSFKILKQYADPRLRIFYQENRGLAATLNRGLGLARGRYVARLDQDDLILSERLAKQHSFLEMHPDVAIVGTWAQIHVGNYPSERYHRHASADDALRLELLFDNPFVHSSIMLRTEVVRSLGGYSIDKSRQPPEDYELWSRIARNHKVANLPEVLTIYREMPGSMSRMGESPFLGNVMRISAENIFHILSTRYSMDDCTALAELYHIGGRVGYRSALTKVKALEMLNLAAKRIAGDKKTWSKEFEEVYVRMRTHIRARFFRRLIPNRLLIPARWLRDKILRMSLPK